MFGPKLATGGQSLLFARRANRCFSQLLLLINHHILLRKLGLPLCPLLFLHFAYRFYLLRHTYLTSPLSQSNLAPYNRIVAEPYWKEEIDLFPANHGTLIVSYGGPHLLYINALWLLVCLLIRAKKEVVRPVPTVRCVATLLLNPRSARDKSPRLSATDLGLSVRKMP